MRVERELAALKMCVAKGVFDLISSFLPNYGYTLLECSDQQFRLVERHEWVCIAMHIQKGREIACIRHIADRVGSSCKFRAFLNRSTNQF